MHGPLHLRGVEIVGRVEGGARVVWGQHQWLNDPTMHQDHRQFSFRVREVELNGKERTYAAAPLESACIWGPLLAWRRVDAVDVDVAFLHGSLDPDLLTLRRGVDQGGAQADLQPTLQGLVGDEAVVPPVLEHADHVGAVVGKAVSDLESIKLS